MNIIDTLIISAFLGLCAWILRPAVRNFKIVFHDQTNTNISSATRIFVLIWLGIGVAATIIMFLVMSYLLIIRTKAALHYD
jgi:hypothetical protein